MAVIVSGKVSLDILIREVLTGTAVAKGVKEHIFQLIKDLPNGTADNQINRVYSKVETGIGASVTTVYDLVGSLTDAEAVAITFAEVVLIVIQNLSSTAANYLTAGPDATQGFGVVASNKGFWADASDRNVIVADGESALILYSKAGVAAAAGSTDELAVITQGGTSSNTWLILIAGRSA
jgi:hypothetical protein